MPKLAVHDDRNPLNGLNLADQFLDPAAVRCPLLAAATEMH